jgi:hypothetical protein
LKSAFVFVATNHASSHHILYHHSHARNRCFLAGTWLLYSGARTLKMNKTDNNRGGIHAFFDTKFFCDHWGVVDRSADLRADQIWPCVSGAQ